MKRSRFRASEGASGTEQERGPQAVRLPSQTWGVSLWACMAKSSPWPVWLEQGEYGEGWVPARALAFMPRVLGREVTPEVVSGFKPSPIP